MFRVRCKACQHLFRVPDEKAGEPIHCPYCQNPIVIRPGVAKVASAPSSASAEGQIPPLPHTPALPRDDEEEAILLEEPPQDSSSMASSPPDASLSPHRARRVKAVFVDCRSCGRRMQISSRDLGKAVQCEACKAVMKVELPTVEASPGTAAAIDEDDPAEPLAQPEFEDIPVRGGFARRRAQARGGVGEKIAIGLFAILLLGGFAWMGHHFMKRGDNPFGARPTTQSSASVGRLANSTSRQPVVDTYSWVDVQNPVVWDKFIDATWGRTPPSLPGLKPTESPSTLFDAGTLTWFKPANPPKQIGHANIRSLLYAFLQQGDELRLCEIRVHCQSTYDREQFQTWLTKQYGEGKKGQSPLATVEWQGQTSAGKDVLIEIGGKVPSFDGSQIRAAIQGVR